MPEPHPDRPGAGPAPTAEQVRVDIEALSDLVASGVEVDGEVQVAESTWVIYGHTSYDGELIVGEYHDAAEAAEILRAAPRATPTTTGRSHERADRPGRRAGAPQLGQERPTTQPTVVDVKE